jgi:hypothetical protein
MEKAPDQSRSLEDLLDFLWRHHPNCEVLVFSSALQSNDVRDRINQHHPRATLQNKRNDPDESVAELVRRITALQGKTAGDLRIVGSKVHFTHPTDTKLSYDFTHWVLYELVRHYPRPIEIVDPSHRRAAARLRAELRERGSRMTVLAYRSRRFQLVPVGDAENGADDQGLA